MMPLYTDLTRRSFVWTSGFKAAAESEEGIAEGYFLAGIIHRAAEALKVAPQVIKSQVASESERADDPVEFSRSFMIGGLLTELQELVGPDYKVCIDRLPIPENYLDPSAEEAEARAKEFDAIFAGGKEFEIAEQLEAMASESESHADYLDYCQQYGYGEKLS